MLKYISKRTKMKPGYFYNRFSLLSPSILFRRVKITTAPQAGKQSTRRNLLILFHVYFSLNHEVAKDPSARPSGEYQILRVLGKNKLLKRSMLLPGRIASTTAKMLTA
jgi:hypothetical protein